MFIFAVFNYAGGAHNVAEVSAADYASFSAANALSSDGSGATTVALKSAGKHYFICGVPGHCSAGMKLAVTAGDSSPGTPAAGTPPTTPSGSGGSRVRMEAGPVLAATAGVRHGAGSASASDRGAAPAAPAVCCRSSAERSSSSKSCPDPGCISPSAT